MLPPSCPATALPASAPRRSFRHARVLPEGGEWVARFLQWIRAEGRIGASTLEAYTLDLGRLADWLQEQDRDLLAVTTDDLNRYVSLRAAQGVRLSTLARHMSSFRRLYAFLVTQGVVTANPAAPVYVPPGQSTGRAPLTDEVLRALLQPSRGRPASPMAAFRTQRDHMLVCMLYATTLGVSDVRLLCWSQFDLHWQAVQVPVRHGASRTHPLDARLVAGLKALRHAAGLPGVDLAGTAYCFPTSSGLPMTRQSLCHLVRQWGSRCGQAQPVTPSALRKTGRTRQPDRR